MLINKTYFTKYSVLPVNYNYDDIMIYEPIAISIWIEPLIGKSLLDELQYQIEHDEVSEANATLLTEGKLWQYLSTAMCYEGLPFLWTRVNEVGITLGESDTYKSITLKDLTYIQDHLRRMLEVLKEQVLEWLCQHQEQFPLFDNCQCSCCNNGLKSPNSHWLLYSTDRRCTDLR